MPQRRERIELLDELSRYDRTRYNTLQHTATLSNTLQHAATMSHTQDQRGEHLKSFDELYHDEHTHCNTLQHTATHCNTLQHTATHRNFTWAQRRERLELFDELSRDELPPPWSRERPLPLPRSRERDLPTRSDESCHTYMWVMLSTSVTSQNPVRRVTHTCESCQTLAHTRQFRVISHSSWLDVLIHSLWFIISHSSAALCARARSTHTYRCIDESCCKYKWVMSHIHLRVVLHKHVSLGALPLPCSRKRDLPASSSKSYSTTWISSY